MSGRARSTLLLACVGALAGALAASARPVRAQARAPERAATVQAEWRQAADGAIPRAEAIARDTARFVAGVQAYGPLDLVVRRAASPDEGNRLRNTFLGVMGAAAGIDPRGLLARWHCGAPCVAARRDTIVARLPQLQQLVADIGDYPRVDVIAAWPDGGYRVGPITHDGRAWQVQAESPTAGLVPWRSLDDASAVAATFRALALTDTTAAWLAGSLRQLGLAAVARDAQGGMRAILAGSIGDNEAGLLFLPAGVAAPEARQAAGNDGRTYVLVAPVAPGVFYYETS